MRVGPHGVLQPIADAVKLLIKEDITPDARRQVGVHAGADHRDGAGADRVRRDPVRTGGATSSAATIPLYIADINVGLLYIVSVASIGVYGIILAGYASNSKYPLLASLRASAQLISYEVAVTMTLVSMIVTAGTLSMVGIIEAQREARRVVHLRAAGGVRHFLHRRPRGNQPRAVRLPEAEQELTGGFHTEYSGMRFALFFLAEYANMIVVSSVATTLFFGGWLRPFPNVAALAFLDFIPGWIWFLLKTFVFLYIFLWIRATLPRYRYDQLMRLGWKVLIPLAIANVVVTGDLKVLL